jgi:trigger factor
VAVIDFEGMLLTGPLENGSAQDHEIELGSNTFIPGFEDGIIGMVPGATTTINLTFPEDYHAKDIAGKPVTFKVTLKQLKKKELPELNDEFAKKLGPYETLEALKNTIREDFQKREERRINEDLKNRLMRALVANNPLEVPQSLLKEQKNALIEDFKNRMAQQGMTPEMFKEYEAKWDEDFTQTAQFMVQSGFLLDAIAQKHDLAAKPEEIENKFKEFAAQTGLELAKIKEFYGDRERRSRLAYQITEEKVVSFLLSKADIKEVSREEIEKDEPKDA